MDSFKRKERGVTRLAIRRMQDSMRVAEIPHVRMPISSRWKDRMLTVRAVANRRAMGTIREASRGVRALWKRRASAGVALWRKPGEVFKNVNQEIAHEQKAESQAQHEEIMLQHVAGQEGPACAEGCWRRGLGEVLARLPAGVGRFVQGRSCRPRRRTASPPTRILGSQTPHPTVTVPAWTSPLPNCVKP